MIASIEKLKIEDIVSGPNLQKLLNAFDMIQNVRGIVEDASENDLDIDPIKVGTAVVHEFFEKMAGGRFPTDFTAEDWKDILNNSAGTAIFADESEYSKYVFKLYIEYIDLSVYSMVGRLSERRVDDVRTLRDEVAKKTDQFECGEIDEARYIEDCLWICLEAMIKLISARTESVIGDDLGQVVDAAATFAFEYTRLTLFRKEQELLAEYLENQKILDVELAAKFERYTEELEEANEQFDMLIKNAFDPEMRNMLHSSVLLARSAGVDESEILKSEDELDRFFS